MEPLYLHLRPEQAPPELAVRSFLAIFVAEQASDERWRTQIAEWLVESGCLYLVAWGVDCAAWHDSVDWALLDAFDSEAIPDDRFIMTTWHDGEPLSHAFWFAQHCASHPAVELGETVLVHVSPEASRTEMLNAYRDSRKMDGAD